VTRLEELARAWLDGSARKADVDEMAQLALNAASGIDFAESLHAESAKAYKIVTEALDALARAGVGDLGLAAGIEQLARGRDMACARLEQTTRERDEARADLLAVAEALGCESSREAMVERVRALSPFKPRLPEQCPFMCETSGHHFGQQQCERKAGHEGSHFADGDEFERDDEPKAEAPPLDWSPGFPTPGDFEGRYAVDLRRNIEALDARLRKAGL